MAIELHKGVPGDDDVARAMALPGASLGDLPVWRMGRAYCALMDEGYTQQAIADVVKRDRTHVSRCAGIFRGLAVEVHEILCQLGSATPDVLKIGALARLLTEDEKPDVVRQTAALQKLIGGKLPRPRNQPLEKTVVERFLRIRALTTPLGMHIAAVETVRTVLQYLAGESDTPWPSTTEIPVPPLPPISPTRSTASTGRKTRSGSSRRDP